jgi:hypothetical protein
VSIKLYINKLVVALEAVKRKNMNDFQCNRRLKYSINFIMFVVKINILIAFKIDKDLVA